MVLVLIFSLSNCGGVTGDDDSDAQQVALCTDMCAKVLCPGNVDPPANFEETCREDCGAKVEQAREDCSARYQEFLECLDELSCDDYYLWYEQEADAPCLQLESELSEFCPGVMVR